MANYFQDPAQSFVPTPLYRPPFEAIQSSLMGKQQKYDAGLASIQNIRNSIFNAPLTNGENSQVRSQFLADAENKLKNLSQVDTSIQSNVNEARNVFAPFYNDKAIVLDMATTEYNNNQLQLGNSMLQSTDPKVREQYWDASVQDIQNTMEDIRNGNRNDAGIYKQRNYIPKQDISAYVMGAIKEAGFKYVNVSGTNGPQLMSVTGGPGSVPSYKAFVQGVIGNKFDDMFGVMGRNEMHNRARSYINSGLSPEDSKALVAKDYIIEKSKDLSDNISMFNKEIDVKQVELNQLLNSDGKYRSQADEYKGLAIKMQLENMNSQSKDLQSSLSSLQNHQSSDYLGTYNSIVKMGDDFFGNIYKRYTANNLATALSASTEVKVEENKAYQNAIVNDRENIKTNSEIALNNAKIRKIDDDIATGNSSSSGSDSGDGSGSGKKKDDSGKLNYQDIGMDIKNPLVIDHTFDTFKEDQQKKYAEGNGLIIDGLSKLLPALGLDISNADATAWAATFKENYSPELGSPKWNDASKPVQDKLLKYLKDKGYKISEGSPSTALIALKAEATKALQSKINSADPFNANELAALTSDIQSGEDILADYNQRKNLIDQKVNENIKSKIKSGDKNFANFVNKNEDGTYSFKTSSQLEKEIGDVPYQTGSVPTFVANSVFSTPNLNIDPRAFGRNMANSAKADGKISAKDIVAAMKKGDGIESLLPSHFITDNLISPEQQHKLLDFYNKYKGFNEAVDQVNNITASALTNLDATGIIGHALDLPIHGITAKEPLGSTGYQYVKEISNTGNYEIPKEGGDDLIKTMEFVNSNPEIVSRVVHNTTGVATLYFDANKVNDLAKSLGTTPKQIGIPTSLHVKFSPVASGDIMNRLPSGVPFQKYQKVIEGGDEKSSDLQDSLGYSYRLYGDNYGQKGTKATKLFLEQQLKKWDPTTNAWIKDERHQTTAPVVFYLSGPNAKTPDEIIARLNLEWSSWLSGNNQIKDNASRLKTNTPAYVAISPDEQDTKIKNGEYNH